MITTVSNITNCSKLLPAFQNIQGNAGKDLNDLYIFLSVPTPEREAFLLQHTQTQISLQNEVATPFKSCI